MIYDITMCDNQCCTVKEHCRRWQTFQRYKADSSTDKPEHVSFLLLEPGNIICDGCKAYWQSEKNRDYGL